MSMDWPWQIWCWQDRQWARGRGQGDGCTSQCTRQRNHESAVPRSGRGTRGRGPPVLLCLNEIVLRPTPDGMSSSNEKRRFVKSYNTEVSLQRWLVGSSVQFFLRTQLLKKQNPFWSKFIKLETVSERQAPLMEEQKIIEIHLNNFFP